MLIPGCLFEAKISIELVSPKTRPPAASNEQSATCTLPRFHLDFCRVPVYFACVQKHRNGNVAMFPLNLRSFFRPVLRYLRRLFVRRAASHPARRAHAISLNAVLDRLPHFRRLQRTDLCFADRIVVFTQNSRYDLIVVGDGEYMITGGWFDDEKLSPHRVRINGCTWGGSMIWRDTVAAPGMCIEFDNRVITSPVRRVLICRPDSQSTSDIQFPA